MTLVKRRPEHAWGVPAKPPLQESAAGTARACSSRRCAPAAGGFTLVEILLVLVIIVVICAIVLPVIQKPLDRQEIQKAANAVRAKLYHARLGAMASDHAYAFQYNCGNGQYRLAPEDDASASPGETASQSGDQGKTADPSDAPRPESGSLPDGICFRRTIRRTPTPAIQRQGAAEQRRRLVHSIIFYPDGTTSTRGSSWPAIAGLPSTLRSAASAGNVVLGGMRQNHGVTTMRTRRVRGAKPVHGALLPRAVKLAFHRCSLFQTASRSARLSRSSRAPRTLPKNRFLLPRGDPGGIALLAGAVVVLGEVSRLGTAKRLVCPRPVPRPNALPVENGGDQFRDYAALSR